MNYETFCNILNKHIFEGEKKELLGKIAEKPERFIGLFRPTNPWGKYFNIFSSHMKSVWEMPSKNLLRKFLKRKDLSVYQNG